MNTSSEIQPVKYRRISDSERNLIIKLYEEGKRIKFISEMLDLKTASVNSVVQTYKKYGNIKRKRGHRKSKLTELQKEEMKSWVDENCQLTLEDLANRVEKKFQIKVSTTTVFSYLEKLHFRSNRSKKILEFQSEGIVHQQSRPGSIMQRNLWSKLTKVQQYLLMRLE